jgi:hypothetical protein
MRATIGSARPNTGVRWVAVVAALAVTAPLAVLQQVLGVRIDWKDPDPVALILPLSIPVSAVLAWRYGWVVVEAREFPMNIVSKAALLATMTGAVAIAIIVAAAAHIRGVDLHDPITIVITVTLGDYWYSACQPSCSRG